MVVGKIRGEWKKFGVRGKSIFQIFCVLSQNILRSLAKLLRSLAKTFAFPRKNLRSLAKICILSQNQLSSDCLLYSLEWFIQLRMFTMERFIEFYFELGLKKYSAWFKARFWDILKRLMWLNVLKQWHWRTKFDNNKIIRLILITLLIILLLIKQNSPEYECNALHVKLFLPHRKRLCYMNKYGDFYKIPNLFTVYIRPMHRKADETRTEIAVVHKMLNAA